jgi:hypothetical protein
MNGGPHTEQGRNPRMIHDQEIKRRTPLTNHGNFFDQSREDLSPNL